MPTFKISFIYNNLTFVNSQHLHMNSNGYLVVKKMGLKARFKYF